LLNNQHVHTSESASHQRVYIGHSPGIYLLFVESDTQQKTVKIIRQ
jgi:hypothetical protein